MTNNAVAAVPWVTACPDWQARIKERRSLIPELPLVDAQAKRAIAIFERLRIPDLDEQPEFRVAVGYWFKEIVGVVFGSWDPERKVRYLREFFLMVPKKNIKTTGGAALMVVAMLMNTRPRAEFLFVAPTIDVADTAFSQAVGMIEADPVLSTKCHLQPHRKAIRYRPTGAYLKIKSFSPKIVTGSKPAGVLLDELHVIADNPQADRVIGQLRGGLVSQVEGFMVIITTQSERPPSGVFKAELHKARAVRDGELVYPMLPVLYEFPEGVDWKDPANWPMVIPNEGFSITAARLVDDYHGAIAAGEGELRRWASQHLNLEIGLALQQDRWPGAPWWMQCAKPGGLTLDYVLQNSDMIAVGIDAGGPEDWMGLCVLGRELETRHWLAWFHAWVHESALAHFQGEANKWRDFEKEGDLTVVEAIGPDVDELVAIVRRVHETGILHRIGLDPAGSAKVLHEALQHEGEIPEDLLIGIGQGWKLVGITKLLERRLVAKTIWHSGSTMLNYCVGNTRMEVRTNAAIITKAASRGKIDPLMALLDAGECLAVAPVPVDVDAMIAPA
ncbi:MAG: terminase large subunit [Cystobacter sp.]